MLSTIGKHGKNSQCCADACSGTAEIAATIYALCNAQGATLASKGSCKFSVPAGAACNTGGELSFIEKKFWHGTSTSTSVLCIKMLSSSSLFAADVCKNGALCPDIKFCPIVPAGGACSPPVAAVTTAGSEAPARVAGDAVPLQVELYLNHTYT